MRHYYRREWQKYRRKVIELDGGVRVRCKRSSLQGAVLQVHHKKYLPGKLPWEYPYELCETLCMGCHAGEHGIIRPFLGWICIGYDDLGELTGECELCGNSIRYVFFVQHQKWPSLEVGETCCDHLTDTTAASDQIESLRRFESRKRRFSQSKRREQVGGGIVKIHQKGAHIAVELLGQRYRLVVNNTAGKRGFSSIMEAKTFAFELLENGKLDVFLAKQKRAR